MADKDNNQNTNEKNTTVNPMKAVKTTPLPTKYEFSSDTSHNKAEKRNKER